MGPVSAVSVCKTVFIYTYSCFFSLWSVVCFQIVLSLVMFKFLEVFSLFMCM